VPDSGTADGLDGAFGSANTQGSAAASAHVLIPGGDALLDATFHQSGTDLVIAGKGLAVTLAGYFDAPDLPSLVTDTGVHLDGDLVRTLTPPEQAADTCQADAASAIGKVSDVAGSVQVQHADGSTAQLAAGDPVFQGDVLQAGADGKLDLVFIDGTNFSLGAGARMTLDNLVFDPNGGQSNSFSATVLQGAFVFATGKIAPSGNMDVKTPVGTIGIRGTTVAGTVHMEGSESVFTLVPDPKTGHVGKVIFTNGGGTQVLDVANATTKVVSFFISPSQPVVLPAADLVQFFDQLLQQFYDSHGGAPSNFEHGGENGKQGSNQTEPQTAEQALAQLNLDNFTTAAGPDAGTTTTTLTGTVGFAALSPLLGFVPPEPAGFTFTTVSTQGGIGPSDTFGDNQTNPSDFGPINQDSEQTQQQQQQQQPAYTVVTGTPDNDNLAGPLNSPGEIIGDSGNDVLTGGNQGDILEGGPGDDTLDAGPGDDQIYGQDGNDTIIGGHGEGNDKIDGGPGVDTVKYVSATQTIIVDLTAGTAYGDPAIGVDTLTSIENVVGGSGNDVIIGNEVANNLQGGPGDDQLAGQGGDDVLDGGQGTDVAIFSGKLSDYLIQQVDGDTYKVTDYRANGDGVDTLTNIEIVRFADGQHLIGDVVNVAPSTPTDADPAANTLAEDAAPGTVVGLTALAIDSNPGDAVTYSLSDDAGGRFAIDSTTGKVTLVGALDYETATSHEITVVATDKGGLTSSHAFTINVTNVNDNPVSELTDTDGAANAVAENSAANSTVGLAVHAADGDAGTTITYSLSDDAGGLFQIDPTSGVVTVKGALDYESGASHQITVVATSSDGSTNSGVFTIGVTNVNEAPVLTAPASQTTDEDAPVAIGGLSVADVDVGSGNMSVTLTVSHGSLTLASVAGLDFTAGANGDNSLTIQGSAADLNAALSSLSYTPDADYNGADALNITTSDLGNTGTGGPQTDSKSVAITVNPVNNSTPVANNDSIIVNEGGTVTALVNGAASVLGNDTDADLPNDSLSASLAKGPAHGSLTLNADGTFTYIHDGSETTADSFTYTVKDAAGHVSGTATVSITVDPVNDSTPVATADAITVNEGGTATLLVGGAASVLANDSDADLPNDVLSATVSTGPAHGSLTLNKDGTFTYIHDGSETTSDSFTYTVKDAAGHVSNAATVSIDINPVNDSTPVAGDDRVTVNEGGTATVLLGGAASLLANDTDADLPNDSLSAAVATGPAHGALTLNADGTFTYVHDGSETTSDSFTYTVKDAAGHVSNTATVAITVTPVNDSTPVANEDKATVGEGGTTAIAVLSNDTDADLPNDSLTPSVATGPAHGTLTLNKDGTFTYVHDGSETTSDSFTYTVKDAAGHVSNTATVAITVTPVNDSTPVANDDKATIGEGGTTTIAVLANDSDADLPNDSLTPSVATGPAHGTLTLNKDGTFTYVHDGSETTSDSFTYTVKDAAGHVSNTATVAITVTPVNDSTPVANDDKATVAEGGTAAIAVLANDTDADLPNDSLTPSVATGPAHGTLTLNKDGTFTYVHDGSETTSDSFTYTVKDAAGHVSNAATVAITVTPVNNSTPVAGDDRAAVDEGGTTTIAVLANDTDSDLPNDKLTPSVASGPAHGTLTLNNDGTFTYVHDGSETTSDSFTYTVRDAAGHVSNTATVSITVAPVNDSTPVANNDTIAVDEGGTATLLAGGVASLLANDTDADLPNDGLSATLAQGPAHGSLTLNADGTFSYVHDGSETTSDSFTYTVKDSAGHVSSPATVSITINPVDDAPTIISNAAAAVAENSTVVTTVAATDPENDKLTYTIIGGADKDLFSIDKSTGVLSFVSAPNFEAPASASHDNNYEVQVQASDGSKTDKQTLHVAVTNVNESPGQAVDIDGSPNQVAEGPYHPNSAVLVGITARATDPDAGDGVIYTLKSGHDGDGKFGIDMNDGRVFTLGGLDFETQPTYNLIVVATDRHGLSSETAFTVNVTNVNEAPTITSDGGGDTASVQVAEQTTAVTTVTATDPDANTTLSYSIIGGDDSSLFNIDQSGNLSFKEAPVFNVDGSNVYQVEVQVSDGSLVDKQTISVTVTDTNDAPVLANSTLVVPAGAPLEQVNPGELQATDTDNSPDQLVYTVTVLPTRGILVIAGEAAQVGSAFTQAAIDAGSIFYVPTDLSQPDSFTVSISDGHTTLVDNVISVTEVTEGIRVEGAVSDGLDVVGDGDYGQVDILGGSKLSLGGNLQVSTAGGRGYLVVHGAGSKLTVGGGIEVGPSDATLYVLNGALVSAAGETPTIDVQGGTVLVSGENSQLDASGTNSRISVGGEGSPQLQVNSNGLVGALAFDIGADSTGVVTVDSGHMVASNDYGFHGGDLANLAGIVTVGSGGEGDGSLNIITAGELDVQPGTAGDEAGTINPGINVGINGGHGHVVVEDDTAAIHVTGSGAFMVVGAADGTGDLRVTAGSVTIAGRDASFGVGAGDGSQGTVTVDLAGSISTLSMTIGARGTGTVTLTDGGSMLVSNDSGTFSDAPDTEVDESLNAGFVTVGGASGAVGALNVLAGGLLTIRDGGDNEAKDGVNYRGAGLEIGSGSGSQGSVTVGGEGSKLVISEVGATSHPFLTVGDFGQGMLQVSEKGLVEIDGNNAVVQVSFADTSDQSLLSSITVDTGGQLKIHGSDAFFAIGSDGTANGQVTVDGAGSLIQLSQDSGTSYNFGPNLEVGGGGAGKLVLSNGGHFEISGAGAFVGIGLGGTGEVDIESGSLLKVTVDPTEATSYGATLLVGGFGTGTLNVSGSSGVEISSPGQSNIGIGVVSGEGGGYFPGFGEGHVVLDDHSYLTMTQSGPSELSYALNLTIEGTNGASLELYNHSTATFDGQAFIAVGASSESSGWIDIEGSGSALTADTLGSVLQISDGYGGGSVTVGEGASLSIGAGDKGEGLGDLISLNVNGAPQIDTGKADIAVYGGGALDIAGGTVNGDVMVTGGGILRAGAGIEAAQINGDLYVAGAGSTVEVSVNDTKDGNHDSFKVAGDVQISDGTIAFHMLDASWDPSSGDAFTFLKATGTLAFDPSHVSAVAYGVDQDFRFTLTASGSSAGFEVTEAASAGKSAVFMGGEQADTFTGTDQNDAIYGGGGNDILDGGGAAAGHDVLNGGAGADTLYGTNGSSDFFEVSKQTDNFHAVTNVSTSSISSDAIDQINNFEVGSDKITFDPSYFSHLIASFNEGQNFSTLAPGVAYDGTNGGANEAYAAKDDALILDGNGNLIYDNNGSDAGYTIVAHVNTTGGTVSASDIHVNNTTS
jgi:T5SS/PEP-CTERM-associated repeat protein/VCBS repeat-containing protein